ncbi:MAG: nuclear transport factor 2 family protein [candidate division Zixibacteria bacterium]|nr:nuclear transport factor 2 family protein [candidate division Zixibacteria bacterium]
MNKLFTLFWMVWTLIVMASTSDISGQAIDSARIMQARPFIDASNLKWCEANRIGDPKLLASLFVEEGALLTRNGRVWRGRAAIDSLFTSVFAANGTSDMTITTLDIWVVDSLAYEYGRFTQKHHRPPEGDSTTATGMYFEIWKQLPDGSWKILRDAGIDPDKGK